MTDEYNPPAPRPAIETASLLRELADGLLTNRPMSEYSRVTFENALHQHRDKVRLFHEAIIHHKMNQYDQIARGLTYFLQHLCDPTVLRAIRDEDAGKFLQAGNLLCKILEMETKAIREHSEGTAAEKKGMDGFDAKKQFNLFFGLINASNAQLPESLKDPKSLQEFTTLAQEFMDIIKGRKEAQPPERITRILDAEDVTDEPVREG